jgi:hypothetical protein
LQDTRCDGNALSRGKRVKDASRIPPQIPEISASGQLFYRGPRFYMRVEARDAADNAGLAETPEPVLIDVSRPRAKIVDVQTP